MTLDMTFFGQGVGVVLTFYMIGYLLSLVKGAIQNLGKG